MKTLFPQESSQKTPARETDNGFNSPNQQMGLEASKNWEYIKSEMRHRLSPQAFHTWIQPIKIRTPSTQDEFVLLVPDMVFYQGLISDYLESLERCKTKLGLDHLSIKVDLQKDTDRILSLGEHPEPKESPSPIAGLGSADKEDEQESQVFSQTLSRVCKLNPNYTFENFVKGPSNQFALATCYNVAENPGINYNPLFLYGSTGLGKTHLLHAVGNRVLSMNPSAIVTYISSERFMNEMIYCIRHNKMWDFRQKYRHCDVFMMDDIQFISGNKATTQEEFFHTFNTLYEAKKQIIITSDLFPQDIPDIEERLRNRFQWGLIADIQPPDVEHRIAILLAKAEKLGVHLTEEVAEYLAVQAKRNVRELEGALHRLAAFAALQGRQLGMALARETFHNMIAEPSNKRMVIEIIQKTVADHFKIKLTDLKSQKRQRVLTLPRQIAMYLARNFTNASFPEIGEKFGGKDHTTVMYAVKNITLKKNKDLDIKAHIESIERHLEQSNSMGCG